MSRLHLALVTLAAVAAGCGSMASKFLPGESIADDALQRQANRAVLSADAQSMPPCASGAVVHTEMVTWPETPHQSPWTERWIVEHCGERLAYLVTFTPDPGGTTFKFRPDR
jgi:hypothetical protein